MSPTINIKNMRSANEQDIEIAGQTYTIFAYRYDGNGHFTYLHLDENGAPAVIVWDKNANHVSFYSLVADRG